MAVRQYIGARYTIKVYENSLDPSSAEWESGIAYEPLTLVTYNNSSYISKKQISAGIGNPASNPTYWACTGYYNGQIINLQDQIDDIVNNELPPIKADITALKKTTRNTAIYIGNSYTAGDSGAGIKGTYELTKDMFNDAHMYQAGGAGFLTYTGHSITFIDLLQNAIDDTSFDNDDVTDIIFLSAWGETQALKNRGASQFTSDLATALQTVRSMINANFNSNVRVSISFIEGRQERTITGTLEGDSYWDEPFYAHWALSVLAHRYGIEYLGWLSWEILLSQTHYVADKYHPNQNGYTVIATTFKQAYHGTYSYPIKYAIFNSPTEIIDNASAYVVVRVGLMPDHASIELCRANLPGGDTVAQYATCKFCDLYPSNPTTFAVPSFGSYTHQLGNATVDTVDAGEYKYRLEMKPAGNGCMTVEGTYFDAAATVANRPYSSINKSFNHYLTA